MHRCKICIDVDYKIYTHIYKGDRNLRQRAHGDDDDIVGHTEVTSTLFEKVVRQ